MSLWMPPEQPEQPLLDDLPTIQLTELATSLLASIQAVLASVQNSIDEQATTLLREKTVQFSELVERIDANTKRTSAITQRVAAWKSSHVDHIQRGQPVATALTRIEKAIPDGHLDQDTIDGLLKLCESAIDAHECHKEHKLALELAISKDDIKVEDYQLMENLLKQSKQLKQALDDANLRLQEAMNGESTKTPQSLHEHSEDNRQAENHTDAHPPENQATDSHSQSPDPPLPPAQTAQSRDTVGKKAKLNQQSGPLKTRIDQIADESKSTNEYAEASDETTSNKTPQPTLKQIERGISSALRQHRFAIAFHLASTHATALPTANVVKMVAINFVDHADPQMLTDLPMLATQLKAEASSVLNSDASADSKVSYVVLLVSSSLWPSTVIAPGGPVAQLIKYLVPYLDRFPIFQDRSSTVAEISLKGLPIIPTTSTGQESWQQRHDKLETEIIHWIGTEENTTLRFPPATQLWRHLLKDWPPQHDDPASASLKFVLNSVMKASSFEKLQAIKPLIDNWRKNADKEIDRIDGKLRHKRVTRDRIVGPVRVRLKRKIQNAVALADEWVSLQMSRPNSATPPHIKLRDQLRNTIDAIRPAFETQNPFHTTHMYVPELTHRMVLRYLNLFNQSGTEGDFNSGVSLDTLLSGDLFASQSVEYDNDGIPTPTVDDLLHLADLSDLDYPTPTILRAQAGRFDIAEMAIAYLEQRRLRNATLITEAEAGHLRTEIQRCRAELKEQISGDLREIRLEIDSTYALGALTAQQSENLRQRSQLRISDRSDIVNFIPLRQRLCDIKNQLTDAKKSLRDSMFQRLKSLESITGIRSGSHRNSNRGGTLLTRRRILGLDGTRVWVA